MELTHDAGKDVKVADRKGRITLGSKYAGKHFSVREQSDGTALLIPVLIVPEKDRPMTSHSLAVSFAWLETLEHNWDRRGSPAPASTLVASAREVLALLQASALARGLFWTEPHIGCNERGQISLEWWIDSRTLTIFIRSEDRVDYLKAWGANIETEMEQGEVIRITDFVALSHWLTHGDAQSR